LFLIFTNNISKVSENVLPGLNVYAVQRILLFFLVFLIFLFFFILFSLVFWLQAHQRHFLFLKE